ncbi:hypothetical protein B0H19DRAFT_1260128 [Mycena capillaripes]|nr:hypothetical protein B0H19DRAFT_1260128 [Mycena capillaripes]
MAAASLRDRGVCCFTGRKDLPTRVMWIIPPAVGDELYPRELEKNKEAFRTVDNALTLCTALAGAFNQNLLSVDVEDASRIVTFQELPSAPPLLSHLSSEPGAGRFWHLNFKWTLQVHFVGGDVSFEPQDPSPEALMDELVEEEADLTNAKWHSGVGAEVLAEYMEQRMSVLQALSTSGDEACSDDEAGFDEGDGSSSPPNWA